MPYFEALCHKIEEFPAMPVARSQLNDPDEFVKRSSLYQEFLAEREEILKLKWLESERLGIDIGLERALLKWIINHRAAWRAKRRGTQWVQRIEKYPSQPVFSNNPNCSHG